MAIEGHNFITERKAVGGIPIKRGNDTRHGGVINRMERCLCPLVKRREVQRAEEDKQAVDTERDPGSEIAFEKVQRRDDRRPGDGVG